MPTELTCPRCSHSMTEGFILDRTDTNNKKVPLYVDGAPEETFWSGLKTGGRASYRVATFRCVGCGHLESYATQPEE